MFIDNKLLLVITLWISVIATTDAAGIRSRRRRRDQVQQDDRALKTTKKGGSGGTQSVVATGNSVFVPPSAPVVAEPKFSFIDACPTEYISLKNCVIDNMGDIEECESCLKGLSVLSSVTISGLNSCSNPTIAGGRCSGCYEQTQNFFNCGAGTSLGVTTTTTEVTGTTNSVTVTETTTTTDTTTTTTTGGFAPITQCPFSIPSSGDDCTVSDGYAYLECYFPDRLKCTCRSDESTGWLCLNF